MLFDDCDLSETELVDTFEKLEERQCTQIFDSPEKICSKSTAVASASASLVNYSDSEEDEGQSEPVVRRFQDPVKPEELEKLGQKTFATSTERKIMWAVNLFQDWHFLRIREPGSDGRLCWCDLKDGRIQLSNLSYCLCKFLSEVRRLDGTEFPAKTLYSIVVMIQMHFDKMGKQWKLIDGLEFLQVKHTLDNLMKSRSLQNVGSENKSADPISLEAENLMWRSGVLGEDMPVKLRDTVMFLIGLSFALRGGEEQRRLCAPGFNPQITVKVNESGKKYLEYVEDMSSKSNQGGLKHRSCKPKVVRAYGNTNFDHDLVWLYEKYCGLLPSQSKCSALYKYPLCSTHVSPKVWYTDKPVGMNKLRDTVKSLMLAAGIDGRYTNHSLRVTAATRMFSKGIEEKVIKERTGHKSNAVRAYERTSEALLQKAEQATLTGQSDSSNSEAYNWEDSHSVIDDVQLDSVKPEYKLMKNSALKCHKNYCVMKGIDGKGGECPKICDVLKVIDTTKDKKVKRLSLSLKVKWS